MKTPLYSKAVKLTTQRIQKERHILESLYCNKLDAIRNDLKDILISKNFYEYKINNGFFENITDYNKVKHILKLFPFIY